MKSARALTKFVRISPQKARLAADLIRGKNVEEAVTQLLYSPLKGSRLLKKTLDSAVANGESLHGMNRSQMRVSQIYVNEGPRLKRAKSKSRGGRVPVLKRTSHFTVVVESL